MKIDYDENYGVLYIALKDCPSQTIAYRSLKLWKNTILLSKMVIYLN